MSKDSELTYGIDKSEPGGDETALTIKDGKTLYTFVGKEAEVIESLIQQRVQEARIEELKKMVKEWGYGEYPPDDFRYSMDWEAWADYRIKFLQNAQEEL